MPDLIGTVLTTRRVVGFALPGPWLDIGTPEAYARAPDFAVLMSAPLPGQPTPPAGHSVASRRVRA
jgi:NDP-sugar pyrophosphorylase family protein